jgi:putative ABC transport system substrate-binding protein
LRRLKGAKPARSSDRAAHELELVINLKTAKALGLVIPQPLLICADELIR